VDLSDVVSRAVSSSLPAEAREAYEKAYEQFGRQVTQKLLAERAGRAVDDALANVTGEARTELDQLSEETRRDLRLQLLESLSQADREVWAPVLSMQSSERFSSKLVAATWGLVGATGSLVVATVVLVMVTLLHH
jgi:hypothetical protein